MRRSAAVRILLFVFCAIPGVFLFVVGILFVLSFVSAEPGPIDWRYVAAASACVLVGAPLVLIGLDRWGQWRYLLVFLAIPLSIVLGEVVDNGPPAFRWLELVVIFGIPLGCAWLIRRLERRRSSRA